MAVKKSELYTSLRSSCDELRGGMDASQYKDYVLTLLFIKYVTDRFKGDPDVQIEIPEKGGSFDDLVEAKGRSDIGDRINKVIRKLADENIKNSFVVILKLERAIDNKKVTKSTIKFYISISYQRN